MHEFFDFKLVKLFSPKGSLHNKEINIFSYCAWATITYYLDLETY
jgi:hypothetical protein